ncbi:hypothetical protein [Escherichia phage BF17]|uniref:Uncharacterized protein n=2 Tax=root TaxID=1 RepID=A0AAU7PHJ4_9CAUD|nr:hypothetical protein [Escherichia coli]MED6536678.1 hypothetical protein [Escherichia coli O157]QAY00827.1 hypothetical protein Ecwhy1_554 [Escherichia phage Ecwhy_1]QXN76533.1 hypothetical protein [Escherichia phage BF17]WGM49787.1 hypothetical protein EcMJ_545 [Escherichia phage vB_Ec-M-J]EGE5776514.1 hypothetical protein [Escherichia coli]
MLKVIFRSISSLLLMISSVCYANEVSDLFEKNYPTAQEMGVLKCKLTSYNIIGSKLVLEHERSTPIPLVEEGSTFSFKYGVNVTSGVMNNVDAETGSTWSTSGKDVFHRMRENGKLKYVYESSFMKRVFIIKNCVPA